MISIIAITVESVRGQYIQHTLLLRCHLQVCISYAMSLLLLKTAGPASYWRSEQRGDGAWSLSHVPPSEDTLILRLLSSFFGKLVVRRVEEMAPQRKSPLSWHISITASLYWSSS
jgi:hypothetical protein